MSIHETQIPDEDRGERAKPDGRPYVLLEQARLRCAIYQATSSGTAERVAFGRIHRELGLAGWCASEELDPARRLRLLAAAHQLAIGPMRHPGRAPALAAIMIEAEDAVATALARTPDEHLHDARMHLLRAMELIAALV